MNQEAKFCQNQQWCHNDDSFRFSVTSNMSSYAQVSMSYFVCANYIPRNENTGLKEGNNYLYFIFSSYNQYFNLANTRHCIDNSSRISVTSNIDGQTKVLCELLCVNLPIPPKLKCRAKNVTINFILFSPLTAGVSNWQTHGFEQTIYSAFW